VQRFVDREQNLRQQKAERKDHIVDEALLRNCSSCLSAVAFRCYIFVRLLQAPWAVFVRVTLYVYNLSHVAIGFAALFFSAPWVAVP